MAPTHTAAAPVTGNGAQPIPALLANVPIISAARSVTPQGLPPPLPLPRAAYMPPLMSFLQRRANAAAATTASPTPPEAQAAPAAASIATGVVPVAVNPNFATVTTIPAFPTGQPFVTPVASAVMTAPAAGARPLPPFALPTETTTGPPVRPASPVGVPMRHFAAPLGPMSGAPLVRPATAVPGAAVVLPPQLIMAGAQRFTRPPQLMPHGQVPVRVMPLMGQVPPMYTAAAVAAMPPSARNAPQAPPVVEAPAPPVLQAVSTISEPAVAAAAAPASVYSTPAEPPDAPPEPPRQPTIRLRCPLCHTQTGGWFLMGCKHISPCIDCWPDPELLAHLYPTCWCGASTKAQPKHKVHLA